MVGRPCKESPFLDDPASYPEYAVLIQRQGLQHHFRCNLHRFRTAALIVLTASSISLSGAVAPSLLACDDGRTGSTISDWVVYLDKGLALDLLRRHFEGIVSAAICMFIMILIVLPVYPLQQLASRAETKNGGPMSISILSSLAVGIPCAFACGVALWSEGECSWGFASSMSVGLMCANLTLKAISFAQISWGLSNAAKRHSDKQTNEVERSWLDFSEFVYFMVTAPSLVCEPRFLRRRARRSPRFARAVSEFFHAALSYLATHAAFSALYAPTMRVIATAFAATEAPEQLAESMWVDPVGWEALPVHDGGGWLCAVVEAFGGKRVEQDPGMLGCNASPAWLQAALAVAFGIMILSPMAHFMAFYSFWHCICLGCAELWGYPDRHFYGPWWLLIDDPRGYLRLWSMPVHRWLLTCIYVPIVKAESQPISSTRDSTEFSSTAGLTSDDATGDDSPAYSCVGHNGDGNKTAALDNKVGRYTEGQRCGGDQGSKDGQGAQQRPPISSVRRLIALCCAFTFSSIVHEAVLFIAMRRTCCPFSSFSLIMSVVVFAVWDRMYPLQYLISYKRIVAKSSAEVTGGAKNPESTDQTPTRSVGNEWRGWGAVAYFIGTSLPVCALIDLLSWQWWRYTHLHHDSPGRGNV